MDQNPNQKGIAPITLSLDDAARYVGIHESSLRRWIREGIVPRVRIGGRVFIKRADLDRLVDESREFHATRSR